MPPSAWAGSNEALDRPAVGQGAGQIVELVLAAADVEERVGQQQVGPIRSGARFGGAHGPDAVVAAAVAHVLLVHHDVDEARQPRVQARRRRHRERFGARRDLPQVLVGDDRHDVVHLSIQSNSFLCKKKIN